MFKTLTALNNLLGTVISLAILALISVAGWFGYHTYYGRQDVEKRLAEREAEIERLGQELEARQREIVRLDTANRLLKLDHRVAQLDVLKQEGTGKDLVTTVSFVELDQQGKPLGESRVFAIQGDMVHVDAQIVKFDDKSIEEGDPERSASLYLFKRLYGDQQKPEEAFSIDRQNFRPAAYRGGKEMPDFEREIWSKFWDYANSQEKAQKAGLRAVHGQGVYVKMVPGKRYRVLLRASDGLSFQPEDLPPKSTQQAY